MVIDRDAGDGSFRSEVCGSSMRRQRIRRAGRQGEGAGAAAAPGPWLVGAGRGEPISAVVPRGSLMDGDRSAAPRGQRRFGSRRGGRPTMSRHLQPPGRLPGYYVDKGAVGRGGQTCFCADGTLEIAGRGSIAAWIVSGPISTGCRASNTAPSSTTCSLQPVDQHRRGRRQRPPGAGGRIAEVGLADKAVSSDAARAPTRIAIGASRGVWKIARLTPSSPTMSRPAKAGATARCRWPAELPDFPPDEPQTVEYGSFGECSSTLPLIPIR